MPYPDNFNSDALDRWWGDSEAHESKVADKATNVWYYLCDAGECYKLAYDYLADPYQTVADLLHAHAHGQPLAPILDSIVNSKAEHLAEKDDE